MKVPTVCADPQDLLDPRQPLHGTPAQNFIFTSLREKSRSTHRRRLSHSLLNISCEKSQLCFVLETILGQFFLHDLHFPPKLVSCIHRAPSFIALFTSNKGFNELIARATVRLKNGTVRTRAKGVAEREGRKAPRHTSTLAYVPEHAPTRR